MDELEGVLTNNVAAIVTTAIFIWYLIRKDKSQNDALEKFNRTIDNHLAHTATELKEDIQSRIKFTEVLNTLVRIVNDVCNKIK